MNLKLDTYKAKLELEENLLEDYIELRNMSKREVKLGSIGGVIVIGVMIVVHDFMDAPIKMFNVISTSFFVSATYHLIMSSLSRRTEYEIKIMGSKCKIEALKKIIESTEGEINENNKK